MLAILIPQPPCDHLQNMLLSEEKGSKNKEKTDLSKVPLPGERDLG